MAHTFYYDHDNNNAITCDFCLRSAGEDTEDYKLVENQDLPDCGMDVGQGGDSSIECACESCQETGIEGVTEEQWERENED